MAIVGAHENARALVTMEPRELEKSIAHGSDLTRDCFSYAVRWLRYLEEYSVSRQVFLEQVLEPARCAAKFKLDLETMTDTTGLILSRSAVFPDRYFGGMVADVSLIVPALECCLSIRCKPDFLGDLTSGDVYDVRGVQPLPYVNRIHPVRISLGKRSRGVSISDLDFLKVSISDLTRFLDTIAFENLCEIESTKDKKRRLGAPCIVGGRLISVAIPDPPELPELVLQSLVHPDIVKMHLNSQLSSNMNCVVEDIKSLEGKNVRLLCAVWYSPNKRVETRPPEVFYIEATDDSTKLLQDEVIGMARLHGFVSQQTVEKALRADIGDLNVPLLRRRDDGGWLWNTERTSSDRITRIFLEQGSRLRNIRMAMSGSRQGSVVPNLLEMLAIQKLQDGAIAQKARDEGILRCLITLLRREDTEGELGDKLAELAESLPGSRQENLEKLWWLHNFGLLSTINRMKVTDRGKEVAYLAVHEEISRLIMNRLRNDRSVVSLVELVHAVETPSPILLRMLRELENGSSIRCYTSGNHRCELLWTNSIGNADTLRIEMRQELQSMEFKALSILGQVHYPLATSKILDSFPAREMTNLALAFLLAEMESKGIISRTEDGLWSYPWEKRIIAILSAGQQYVFSTDALMKQASIPYVEKNRVLQMLNLLKSRGIVRELTSDGWALQTSDEATRRAQVQQLFAVECKGELIKYLRAQGGWVNVDALFEYARAFLSEKIERFDGNPATVDGAILESLSQLTAEQKISKAGPIIRLTRTHDDD